MENKFGKVSRVSICAGKKDVRTILEDVSFTAPYKIMTPFEKENGGIQVMPLCASAGDSICRFCFREYDGDSTGRQECKTLFSGCDFLWKNGT